MEKVVGWQLAEVFATEVALSITHDVFGICGTSATLGGNKFGMFWRNIRILMSHDPVDRRREAIGSHSSASPIHRCIVKSVYWPQ